ncbi:hypothetical protein M422DRAFT_269341 [Sphaerobolus stellatus SS14]|uniref:Uncharacterized protein n=1 Tax=Sphaerobolus stellatus (strain SS14) TaxID=990650 RepID=A0A0C9TIA8_SPHS4|nr:hypothetical protein M422DRAFT_269341 [Sphaerobolus stellatus SS14]
MLSDALRDLINRLGHMETYINGLSDFNLYDQQLFLMALSLLLLHSLAGLISAAPLSNGSSATFTQNASNPTLFFSRSDLTDQTRSLGSILRSCLVTTIAVSWLAVHPNIPSPDEKAWWIYWRSFKLMFWATVAPEYVTIWAWRQLRGARRVAKEVRKLARKQKCLHGTTWTPVHGHFLQMGGFLLYENGAKSRILIFEDFRQLVISGQVTIPSITEEEIWDRSKRDFIGKAIAFVQIAGFIAQFFGRIRQQLLITPLEVTTTALAFINIIMYLFWWSKPFDVRFPLRVDLLQLEGDSRPTRTSENGLDVSNSGEMDPLQTETAMASTSTIGSSFSHMPRRTTYSEADTLRTPEFFSGKADRLDSDLDDLDSEEEMPLYKRVTVKIGEPIIAFVVVFYNAFEDSLEKRGVLRTLFRVFIVWPWIDPPLELAFGEKYDAARQKDGSKIQPPAQESKDHVDTCYVSLEEDVFFETFIRKAPTLSSGGPVAIALVFAMAFGGIHLSSVRYQFPIELEGRLWEAGSVVLTCTPALAFVLGVLACGLVKYYKGWITSPFTDAMLWILSRIPFIPFLATLLARLFILVLAFMTLRKLPAEAYTALDWFAFIPHF